jgi:hypothetical protein
MNTSAGTGLVDCSAPQTSGVSRTLYGGNFIVAKVNNVRTVLKSAELQQLLDNGYDVEIVRPL